MKMTDPQTTEAAVDAITGLVNMFFVAGILNGKMSLGLCGRFARRDLDQSWSDLKKEMNTACDEVRKSSEYAEYEKSKDKVKKTWAEVKAEFKKGLDEGRK